MAFCCLAVIGYLPFVPVSSLWTTTHPKSCWKRRSGSYSAFRRKIGRVSCVVEGSSQNMEVKSGADWKILESDSSDQQQMAILSKVGNLEQITLHHAPSNQQVQVVLFGATVTSWKKNQVERFFLSQEADFSGQKPIRGGIPLCFPQFGPYGPLAQHGFARISYWHLKQMGTTQDRSANGLILSLSNQDLNSALISSWPFLFTAEYQIILGFDGLETHFRVRNDGEEPFSFTFAFHNYFDVSDVSSCQIFGLENIPYCDRRKNDEWSEGEENLSGFQMMEPVDRIYSSTPDELAIFDSSKLQIIKIKKYHLPDSTLWNPFGIQGSDPGWKRFLCLEPGAIKSPIHLKPVFISFVILFV
ncbi:Putative glucose-6-phosphate 1-epimerase [Galdieria sulphuraria]|nr:Putative glucose-6-phosphate 1-epimerase [Galdieria sulphuraria]